jgi:hypothetical protein
MQKQFKLHHRTEPDVIVAHAFTAVTRQGFSDL